MYIFKKNIFKKMIQIVSFILETQFPNLVQILHTSSVHVPLQLCPVLVLRVASLIDLVGKLSLLAACRHSKDYLLHILRYILAAWSVASLYLFITFGWQKFYERFGRLVLFKFRFGASFGLFFLFKRLDSNLRFLFLS